MSGGFFRGTSADQDTRFSNKQAKLLKSQKFAPELDTLVEVSKVSMDVIKPWIANRVTQLLGFEDEVLINFIYGLLEGKVVNGKEIQIQITGFMEKNTGKFMKELWTLLLSAQKNASGVPQQFLDAKEEEIRKKKVESDRITSEIQKKKELEQEKQRKMDDERHAAKAVADASKAALKNSTAQPEDDKGSGEQNGLRGKNRSSKSPDSVEHSPSADRVARSRSISKSFSNSRSYSDQRSRSISTSPQSRRQSISPDRRYRSPRKRSVSPRRKYSPRRTLSPLRRRSPYIRRRSPSLRRHRSPSRRRCRSPSPARRRSPLRMRHRSPPLLRRRSPSPFQRRSAISSRGRSPSPRRRSPSPVRRRSPPRSSNQRSSLLHSPRRSYRSGSPFRNRSPAYQRKRSLSRDDEVRTNGVRSRRYSDEYESDRAQGNNSPDQILEREGVKQSGEGRKGLDLVTSQPPTSLRSPQREPRDRSDVRKKWSVSSPTRESSPSQSGSSLHTGGSSPRRSNSLSAGPIRNKREHVFHADRESPVRERGDLVAHDDGLEVAKQNGTRYSRANARQRAESPRKRITHSPTAGGRNIRKDKSHNEEYSPERSRGQQIREVEDFLDDVEIQRDDRDKKSEKSSLRTGRPISPEKARLTMQEAAYGPGNTKVEQSSPENAPDEHLSIKQPSSPSAKKLSTTYTRGNKLDETKNHRSHNVVESGLDSENDKNKSKDMERRKHKTKDRQHISSDDDNSYDSHLDERKESKRRKKEEKRLRKEEKRRRREERHRRKEERRAGKQNGKTMETVTLPSDIEKNRSDDSLPSDTEEIESAQKKLEIELRKKALESLRAKKAINS